MKKGKVGSLPKVVLPITLDDVLMRQRSMVDNIIADAQKSSPGYEAASMYHKALVANEMLFDMVVRSDAAKVKGKK